MSKETATGSRPSDEAQRAFFLASIAIAIFLAELTLADPRDPVSVPVLWSLCFILIGSGLRFCLSWVTWQPRMRWVAILVIAGGLLPVARELIAPLLDIPSMPVELVGIAALRNIVLVLAASHNYVPLAMLASAFIAVFSVTQVFHPLLLPSVATFGLLATTWLALSARAPRELARSLPIGPLIAIAISYAAITIVHSALPLTSGGSLAEWLSSSGGSRWKDTNARGGVGDGDAIVDESDQPQSDGGDGSKILESHQPSFYDAFTEAYGEPVKTKDTQRAIPLPMQQIAGHQQSRNHQASREFALQRKLRGKRHAPESREATALAYVTGPTPLYLRVESYTVFDGMSWHAPDEDVLPTELPIDREVWFQLPRVAEIVRADPVEHTIKIGGYCDRMLPLPTIASEFRIGIVNRSDFFILPSAGVVWLADPFGRISGGEIIETTSDTIDYTHLDPPATLPSPPRVLDPSIEQSGLQQLLEATVRSWTTPAQSDWEKVRAVTQRLRSDFVHERIASPDEPANLVTFLREKRCGPDYLFATAAALLCREIGFESRLATGYYASPAHYDHWSRSTPVSTSDVHTWPEVLVGTTWIPLEPTPGYELPPPYRSWRASLARAFHWTSSSVSKHASEVVIAILVLAAALRYRAGILDSAMTLHWYLLRDFQAAGIVHRTLYLLDLRMALAGARRPQQASLRRWILGRRLAPPEALVTAKAFIDLFETLNYGSETDIDRSTRIEICTGVVRELRRQTLRRFAAPNLDSPSGLNHPFQRKTRTA